MEMMNEVKKFMLASAIATAAVGVTTGFRRRSKAFRANFREPTEDSNSKNSYKN